MSKRAADELPPPSPIVAPAGAGPVADPIAAAAGPLAKVPRLEEPTAVVGDGAPVADDVTPAPLLPEAAAAEAALAAAVPPPLDPSALPPLSPIKASAHDAHDATVGHPPPVPFKSEEEAAVDAARAAGAIVDATAMATLVGVAEPLSLPPPGPPAAPKPPKKPRAEFTAREKLAILSELDGPDPPPVQALLEKHGVSKSSLHRWRQPDKIERLRQMVADEAAGNRVATKRDGSGRKRDMPDKLAKIKGGLQRFCDENLQRPVDERLAVTSALLQAKAAELRTDLLAQHAATPGFLADDEAAALTTFQCSKSWACATGNRLGYLRAPHAIQFGDKARQNTEAYLAQRGAPKPPKKQRTEFTASEKLAILRELEETNAKHKAEGKAALTVDEMCRKHSTSKSSIHRWKQQHRAGKLVALAAPDSGRAHVKRVANDRLAKVKAALNEFYLENAAAGEDRRAPMNYASLQSRAMYVRETLLERHYRAVQRKFERERAAATKKEMEGEQPAAGAEGGEAIAGKAAPQEGGAAAPVPNAEAPAEEGAAVVDADVLPPEDVKALENFKASNSWLRDASRKFRWALDSDAKREGGTTGPAMAYHGRYGVNSHGAEPAPVVGQAPETAVGQAPAAMDPAPVYGEAVAGHEAAAMDPAPLHGDVTGQEVVGATIDI
ncbi:hypothetical protein ACHAXT_003044 [Thalassiosira profunda]